MPELPEVEVVRLGMVDHLQGHSFEQVRVHDPRSLRRHEPGPGDFAERLVGRRVEAVRRRGKYLWLELDDSTSLVVHLGMSGQVLVDPVDFPKHTKIEFVLDNSRRVLFVDQRIFGGMFLDSEQPPAAIDHIALDLLDPACDRAELARKARRRRSGVKRALLDQSLVSGIGNIYADEALWRARIHFDRSCDRIGQKQFVELLDHAADVMGEALAQGGTSFDALYVDVKGEQGWFARELAAYGREGEPCARCGSSIVREPFMGRSSYRCPRCQRKQSIRHD